MYNAGAVACRAVCIATTARLLEFGRSIAIHRSVCTYREIRRHRADSDRERKLSRQPRRTDWSTRHEQGSDRLRRVSRRDDRSVLGQIRIRVPNSSELQLAPRRFRLPSPLSKEQVADFTNIERIYDDNKRSAAIPDIQIFDEDW